MFKSFKTTALAVTAALSMTGTAMAQECFLGEVKMFAGNFAPRGYALAHGQLLPIAQYSAVFSILGTMYGGDGRTTFALPDLRGRSPIGVGTGPGLAQVREGQKGGAETHSLTVQEMPSHGHSLHGTSDNGATPNPAGNVSAGAGRDRIYGAPSNLTPMAGAAIANAGGSQPHNIRDPWLGINYIVCLQGIFPSRN